MTDYGTEFTTALGRIVYGHPAVATDKTDPQTKQPKIGNDGQRIKQWSFGLAIPKDQIGPLWQAMQMEAAKGFPQGIPNNFSWKLKDGDGVDRNGKPYAERTGYAGCYVLAISSELQAPPMYVYQNGAYMQLQPDQLKTGDFVTVGLNLKVNVPANRTHTPGLYINPLSVLLMFEGDEIKTGYVADPNALFGQQQPQYAMPAGARPIGSGGPVSQQPPVGAGMPGMMPQMPPMAQPMMQPAPAAPVAATSYPAAGLPVGSNMPPPATDFIPGAPQMQPQMQPGGYPNMPGAPAPR